MEIVGDLVSIFNSSSVIWDKLELVQASPSPQAQKI